MVRAARADRKSASTAISGRWHPLRATLHDGVVGNVTAHPVFPPHHREGTLPKGAVTPPVRLTV